MVALLLTLAAVPATAAEDPETRRWAYELGATGDTVAASCGCQGQIQDGWTDLGAVRFSAGADGISVQASVVDDAFGTLVGGTVCTDENRDNVYCDRAQGEVHRGFCRTSPKVDIPHYDGWHDGDRAQGHYDTVAVFLNGPVGQASDCDPAAAPTATTGGYLDPAGGVLLKVWGSQGALFREGHLDPGAKQPLG